MTSQRLAALRLVSALIGGMAMQSCGDEGIAATPRRHPSVVVVHGANQPLALASIRYLNGTYGAGCAGAATNAPWSVSVVPNPEPGELANPPLALYVPETLGPSGCQITLTQVVARSSGGTAEQNVTYTSETGLLLGQTWSAGNVRRFAGGSSGVDFYGNAVMSATESAVTIEFRFSEDPTVGDAPVTVPLAGTFTYAAEGSAVSAPQYEISFAEDSGSFERGGVITMIGDATLQPPTPATGHTFLGYVVSPATFDAASTFASVHAEFERLTGAPASAVAVSDPLTGAEVTTLLASTTPASRSLAVIVATTDTATGIRTYQVITLSFRSPPRSCGVNELVSTGCVCDDGRGVYQGRCEWI